MSKVKILRKLKIKGIVPINVEFIRSEPTPYGYASGWNLEFNEDIEDIIYELSPDTEFSTLMEFGKLSDVTDWIDTLPCILTPEDKQ